MDKVRLAIIGLGCRGMGLLEACFLKMTGKDQPYDDVIIDSLCDFYQDRVEKAADKTEEVTGERPFTTTDYKEILKRDSVDAVVVATSWETHISIAIEALNAGKYVGCEVGGAYNIEECRLLVETAERVGLEKFMLLENCCFGQRELMVTNMVRQGLFGDIVHCDGAYAHDIREEVAKGKENRHYRLRNYLSRNCENYPTHELGPIAKLLDINKGNRFVSLVSVASCSKGLERYVKDHLPEDHFLQGKSFAQADIITTVIKCANGQTIRLSLDTTLPRGYSRGFSIHGTKGAYFEDNDSVFIDGVHNTDEFHWKPNWGNAEKYEEEYETDTWIEYKKNRIGGHDGIDWLCDRAFIESIKAGTVPPIDVYDAAAWMCITPLSEQSILQGGVPVAIPDFTNGKWAYYKVGDTIEIE